MWLAMLDELTNMRIRINKTRLDEAAAILSSWCTGITVLGVLTISHQPRSTASPINREGHIRDSQGFLSALGSDSVNPCWLAGGYCVNLGSAFHYSSTIVESCARNLDVHWPDILKAGYLTLTKTGHGYRHETFRNHSARIWECNPEPRDAQNCCFIWNVVGSRNGKH